MQVPYDVVKVYMYTVNVPQDMANVPQDRGESVCGHGRCSQDMVNVSHGMVMSLWT
jgi:hypothetical protein